MLARIWQIIAKEFIQFSRDRLLSLFLFIFPVMQLILVAQATGTGVLNLPTAILDQDNSRTSRDIAQVLDNTEELKLKHFPTSIDQLEQLLDGGRAGLGIVIPPNFEQDLFDPNTSPHIQIMADGSNSIAGKTGLNTAEGAINRYLADRLAAAGIHRPLDLRVTIRYNQSLDARNYAVPAQLAFILYQVTLVIAALGLARERELGTLEQLMVTPLRRLELLVGKSIPSATIGLIDFSLLFFIVTRVYHIPMKGSSQLLFLLTVLFVAAEVSWGMMISAISRTQQQSILFVFLVAITEVMLSGYMVPVERLPIGLKIISVFSPIRHYMIILRAIMLKGANLTTLWPEAAALLALTVGVAYLSLRNVARVLD